MQWRHAIVARGGGQYLLGFQIWLHFGYVAMQNGVLWFDKNVADHVQRFFQSKDRNVAIAVVHIKVLHKVITVKINVKVNSKLHKKLLSALMEVEYNESRCRRVS